MHILKFGGTSMGDAESWQRVLKIIRRYNRPFVIVSATARTTRKLLAAAEKALTDLEGARKISSQVHDRHSSLITNFINHQVNATPKIEKECTDWINQHINILENYLAQIYEQQELSPRIKDAVASIGERLSSYLFARCGATTGLSTRWINATEIIRTNSDFEKASPQVDYINEQAHALMDELGSDQIPVMGGYYGQDFDGNITTLGFEGSDYSASLIGAALSAEAIEIWTDVSGIYTCDPRLIPNARPIPQLSFQEATELAYFGAKVLHPSTTKPASQNNIPIQVKNIFDPDEPGTRISHKSVADGRVKAMTFKENCAVITVTSSQTVMGYEFLAGVFDILRWQRLPVDVVTTTEASVSIAIENDKALGEAIEQLKKYGSVDLQTDQGIISLVGCTENKTKSLLRDVLGNISVSTVNLVSISQKKGNLNIVMNTMNITDSVKSIHKMIFS